MDAQSDRQPAGRKLSNEPESSDSDKFQDYLEIPARQITAPIAMEANKFYLFEVYHVDNAGGNHLAVGVEVPNAEEKPNSVNEILEVKISYTAVLEVVDLRIWGATGGNWKITIGERTCRSLSWGASASMIEYVGKIKNIFI